MQLVQGCGKTTLVEQLEALFEHTGGKAAVFSMDDCYLTRADQEQLAQVRPLQNFAPWPSMEYTVQNI